MKILHIGNMKSGIDMYVRNAITYSSSGFEYVVIHGEKDDNKPFLKDGKMVREYSIPMYRNLNLFRDFLSIIQTISIIRKEKPNVVHCHSAKGGFIGRCAGFVTGVRTLYTPHAFSFLSAESSTKRFIYLWLERLAKFDSFLLACSESEQTLGIDLVHYNKEKALLWNNAVPDVLSHDTEIDQETHYICSIGRPSYQKNTFFLLDVFRELHLRHPEVVFLLLGAGYYSPYTEELQRRIADYGLDDFFLILPWLSHQETLNYVQESLLYLTVSKYEGLPLSVIEAMALKKAVVASDVVGNKDCVSDGVNGFLLPLEKNLFVDKLSLLIEDRQKCKELGRYSRKAFEKHFLIDRRIGYLEKIYRQE